MDDRRRLLGALVAHPETLDSVRGGLLAPPHDCPDNLVVLRRTDICNALEQFLAGSISSGQIEQWADLLEGRPGVDLEVSESADDSGALQVSEALYILSTPELEGALTPDFARELIARLQSSR